jgi:hypothetical protein
MLPTTSFIFSTILPRRSWHYSSNCSAMENARKRVNRAIRTFFQYNCAYVEDCHTSMFKDGVHLSFLGNDIFINIIQGAWIELLWLVWDQSRSKYYLRTKFQDGIDKPEKCQNVCYHPTHQQQSYFLILVLYDFIVQSILSSLLLLCYNLMIMNKL